VSVHIPGQLISIKAPIAGVRQIDVTCKLKTLGKRIQLNTPTSNSQQRTWDDLVALISKLRWIGEEAEARELELKLRAEATRLELQLRESPTLRRLLTLQDSIRYETD
jgi:hypothetical protein